MPGMSGEKFVHSGMRPPEVKNVVVKKGAKTAEKLRGKYIKYRKRRTTTRKRLERRIIRVVKLPKVGIERI